MRSSPDRVIDLNADVGEGCDDAPLFAVITSANVACGGHVGDPATMRDAVRAALRHGVAIGAHPSYPDPARFGRVTMALPPEALAGAVASQIAALARIASEAGAAVAHVKAHGALYNDAAGHDAVASAVADGALRAAPACVLFGLAGSRALRVWRERGIAVAAEGFADRAYEPDGTLRPRSQPGALIVDPQSAAAQAVRLALSGICDTVCVHGDTPGAADIARAVRGGLDGAGFTVRARRAV